MSEEWHAYVKDPRQICKYGSKCYQKNPEHHKTFKHPPVVKEKNAKHTHKNRHMPYVKERKPTHDVIKKDKVATTTIKDHPKTTENRDHTIVVKLPENITYYDKGVDHKILKELFLVDMPNDFFKFYECLNGEEQPMEKMLSSVNLELIGPYDFLLGKLPILDDKELYLIHWRFFYDPPEFQAVLKIKGESQFHIGYYRDDPKEKPSFMASNDSAKDYHLTPVADNIFGAVYLFLQDGKNDSPFTHLARKKLSDKIKKWAEEHQFSLEKYEMKRRVSNIVTRTFHGAGIVVPYNKKTQLGYRNLTEPDETIKKLFAKLESANSDKEKDEVLSELQPVITYANIAVDECDFGTGLEIGIDLFCSGLKELHSSALNSLNSVYTLLNREAFKKIIQAHLKYRRKGANMSILSLNKK